MSFGQAVSISARQTVKVRAACAHSSFNGKPKAAVFLCGYHAAAFGLPLNEECAQAARTLTVCIVQFVLYNAEKRRARS
jgi:hypothetical protein